MIVGEIVNLLRTLIIIVGVYYLLKFIGRFIRPFAKRWVQSKMEEQMRQGFGQQQASKKETIKDDGKVKVERVKKKPSSNTSADDEYIDYEEV